jgi:hypothetical protein
MGFSFVGFITIFKERKRRKKGSYPDERMCLGYAWALQVMKNRLLLFLSEVRLVFTGLL